MMFYFSHSVIAKGALASRKGIESDFKSLCQSNPEFLKSIESTTKSLDATVNRLRIWGEVLAKRLKSRLQIPRLQNNQIVIS